VLPGDDEEVDRRLAVCVSEGQHIALVEYNLGVYLTTSYFTEYAIRLAHNFSSNA
jgi:hypothetical protein